MRRASVAAVLVAVFVAAGACSSSTTNSDCTCDVKGTKIACGVTQCLDNELWACSGNARLDDRGACVADDGGIFTEDSGGSGDDTGAPDTRCSDLAAFCDAHCQGNASAYADCVQTANQGDGIACASWEASSSSECR